MDKTEVVQQLTSEMEAEFKGKGLEDQLDSLVNRALEMNDDQVRGALIAMKSPIVIVTGKININGKFFDAKEIQDKLSWRTEETYKDDVPMGMWRRIVEVEALNREIADVDLDTVLKTIAKKVSAEHGEQEPELELDFDLTQPDEPQPKRKRRSNTGFTAKDAPKDVRKKVVILRKKGMAFHKIEGQLGLRQVRGMTAYRIYRAQVKARKG